MTGGRRTAREQFKYWLAYWYTDSRDMLLPAPTPEESAVFEALNKIIDSKVSATASEITAPSGGRG